MDHIFLLGPGCYTKTDRLLDLVPGLCFTDPWSILFQISWCLLCCFLEGVSNWLGSSAHSVLYSCVASGGSLCLSGPRLHAGWVMLVLSAMPLQAVGSPQEAPFGFEEDSEGQSRTQVIGSYPQLGKQIPGPWAVVIQLHTAQRLVEPWLGFMLYCRDTETE